MSESQWHPIDVWHGGNADGNGRKESADNEPQDGWHEFFRCDPAGFYAFHKRQVESLCCPKDKRDYYTNAARRVCAWATRNRAGILISFASVACFLGLVVYLPDAVVALFTVALTLLAYVQWTTMDGELEQVRRTADQTDKMIAQMALEQRAWLSCHPQKAQPPEAGRKFKFAISVKNTGKTPATVVQFAMTAFSDLPDGGTIQGRFNLIDLLMDAKAIEVAKSDPIAPDTSMVYNYTGTGASFIPTPEDVISMNDGTTRLFVAARIEYEDVLGGTHITQACFVYMPSTKELWVHNAGNRMT